MVFATYQFDSMEGKLHIYHPSRNLNLFEYTCRDKTSGNFVTETPPNILLFIGGLFDNFGTPSYVSDIARLFPRTPSQIWAVMHVQLSSAMKAWGTSSLDRDIDEISTCIHYVRDIIRQGSPTTKIVLMGHSTGCQDIIHYLHSPNPARPNPNSNSNQAPRPQIQGAILQAAVSDREQVLHMVNTEPHVKKLYDQCIDLAKQTEKAQHRYTFLPTNWTTSLFGPAPISIVRFLSLASPKSPENPSQDDLFSSDLTDDRLNDTFGKIGANGLLAPPAASPSSTNSLFSNTGKPPSLLILLSGADEYTPETTSQPTLLQRWRKSLASNKSAPVELYFGSRVIEHASHDIGGDEAEAKFARLVEMRQNVLMYLQEIGGGAGVQGNEDYGPAWEIWRTEKDEIANLGHQLEQRVADVKL